MEEALKRAKILHEHLIRKEPPKPSASWECKYCEFEKRCVHRECLMDE